MFTIDWQPNGKGKWYHIHEKFVFKKERQGENHIYKIYDHEQLMYNTLFEHEFLKRARYVCVKNSFPSGNHLIP